MPTGNGHRPICSIDEIADQYLVCRDLGHQFVPYDVRIMRRLKEIQRLLRCRNCGTIRNQILTLDGYLTGKSSYLYPEQQDPDAEPYCLKGLGRLNVEDRAHIRVLSTNVMTTKG